MGYSLAAVDSNLPFAGRVTLDYASREQSLLKHISDRIATQDDKVSAESIKKMIAGTDYSVNKATDEFAKALSLITEKDHGKFDALKSSLGATWRMAVELSKDALDGGHSIVQNLARWQKSFFDAFPDYFDGSPPSWQKRASRSSSIMPMRGMKRLTCCGSAVIRRATLPS